MSSSWSNTDENLSSYNSNLMNTTLPSSDDTTSQFLLVSPHDKKNAGRKKLRETCKHLIYTGARQRSPGKWVCEVREPNKKSRIWLGTFPTPEMAARAYDVAAIALRGTSATLNFRDSLWVLPRAKSSLAKDIRLAALEGVEAFRPTSSSSSSSFRTCLCSLTSPSSSTTPKSATHAENPKIVHESYTPFLDEDALFNMPALLASMAEGMLIAPIDLQERFHSDDDMESNVDLSLWSE